MAKTKMFDKRRSENRKDGKENKLITGRIVKQEENGRQEIASEDMR